MIQLSSFKQDAFLARFYNLHDAVVRGVALSVGSPNHSTRAVVSLAARDSELPEGKDWVKLQISIRDVKEFRLEENKNINYYVLSLGLKIGYFDGLYYLDFGPESDEPDRVDDYRKSKFYLAGVDYREKVHPYPKSWEYRKKRG